MKFSEVWLDSLILQVPGGGCWGCPVDCLGGPPPRPPPRFFPPPPPLCDIVCTYDVNVRRRSRSSSLCLLPHKVLQLPLPLRNALAQQKLLMRTNSSKSNGRFITRMLVSTDLSCAQIGLCGLKWFWVFLLMQRAC